MARGPGSELSISGDETPSWIFRALHQWVARWLLHWAELDFAENGPPRNPKGPYREGIASIKALWSLLEALRMRNGAIRSSR